MSLSELELLEHATHLGGEKPDGRGGYHTFLLEASVFSQKQSGKLQERWLRAITCWVVTDLNKNVK